MSKQPAAPPQDHKNMWTVDQVRIYLNVSKSEVYKMVREGKLRSYRFNTLVRFDHDELMQDIRTCRHVVPATPFIPPIHAQPVDIKTIVESSKLHAYTSTNGKPGERKEGLSHGII